MAWQTGQADGYLELVQALIDCATNSHVSSVTVNAGGSGYAVGDILRINGGTTVGGFTAAVEVLTLSGSAVATVRIARAGAYTVNPGIGTSTTAETGAGAGCTLTTSIASSGWTLERRTQEAVSATVASGGTGYTNGDSLTVLLGNGVQGTLAADAVFQVTSTSGGAVTAVSLVSAGNYEESPTGSVNVSGGTGSGAQLTVTWQDAATQDQVIVLRGTPGGGFANPYIAIETYQDIDQFTGAQPVRNWALFGLVNWNALVSLREQASLSPGMDFTGGATTNSGNGIYRLRGLPNLPLKDTDASYPLTFWFSVTGRRIRGVIEVTNSTPIFHYPSFYLGFFNQAGTRAEMPYPMYVGGACWRRQSQFAETTPVIGGISEAPGSTNSSGGSTGESSAYYWDSTASRWYASINFDFNDAGTSLEIDETDHLSGLYPLLSHYTDSDTGPTAAFGADIALAIEWYDDLIDRSLPTQASAQLLPTPNGATDKYLLVPLTLFAHWLQGTNPTGQDTIYGELDGCHYVSAAPAGSVSTLDSFIEGAERYRVFQNGNRTQFNSSYFVMLEA